MLPAIAHVAYDSEQQQCERYGLFQKHVLPTTHIHTYKHIYSGR
jgi:hypothetical protein